MSNSKMMDFISKPDADEARRVLVTFIKENPSSVKKAYNIAIKIAAAVDVNGIMDDVFGALDSLDMDDLSSRAGRTRYGYVEPSEAAWELFEEKIEPFIGEMMSNYERELPDAAKAYCIGIVMGLKCYEKSSSSDLADWLPDAPGECIYSVVKEWKKGNPSDADIAEVMDVVKGGCS